MTISVPKSDWGPRVRQQVELFDQHAPNFSWGTYPGHDPSEALATDGMVPDWSKAGGKARGRGVAQWIWDNRRTNGIWYVIHWGEIISITYPNAGWRPYFNASSSNPSKSHKNHVHTSWKKDGAAPAVVVDAPKPYTDGWLPPKGQWIFYLDKQEIGVTNSTSVWLLQRALGIKPRDGVYTKELRDKVAFWQMKVMKDDPKYCDGILGPKQAKALFSGAIPIRASSK